MRLNSDSLFVSVRFSFLIFHTIKVEMEVIEVIDEREAIVIGFDIGLNNFSYCVFNANHQRVIEWHSQSLSLGGDKTNSATIFNRVRALKQRFDRNYLPELYDKTYLIEKQLVKVSRTGILPNAVTLKMIEVSIYSVFSTCGHSTKIISPKDVSVRYGLNTSGSYYSKKNVAILKIKEFLATEQVLIGNAMKDNWNSKLKKDDLADSLLIVLYHCNINLL